MRFGARGIRAGQLATHLSGSTPLASPSDRPKIAPASIFLEERYMTLEERTHCRRMLKRRGFDMTKSYRDGTVLPRCSQCQAMCINGVACHETGCPNQRRKR